MEMASLMVRTSHQVREVYDVARSTRRKLFVEKATSKPSICCAFYCGGG